MATVTGLTAERMLEIEAESIVGGAVDPVTGRLHLTRHDGGDIDAGPVVWTGNFVDIVTDQPAIDGHKTFLQDLKSVKDIFAESGTANQVRIGVVGAGAAAGIEFGGPTNFIGTTSANTIGIMTNGVVRATIDSAGTIKAKGTDHYFGAFAIDPIGSRLHILTGSGAGSDVYLMAESSSADSSVNLRVKGAGFVSMQNAAGQPLAKVNSVGVLYLDPQSVNSSYVRFERSGVLYGAVGITAGGGGVITGDVNSELVIRGDTGIRFGGGGTYAVLANNANLNVGGGQHSFGAGALGAGAGNTMIQIGSFGDTISAYVKALNGTGGNTNLVIRPQGTGQFQLQNSSAQTTISSDQGGTTKLLRASDAAVLFQTELVDGGTANTQVYIRCGVNAGMSLQRISLGAADSGGAGWRMLRVPN